LFAPTNYSSADSAVMSLIQDQLLTYGPDGSLQPAIATSWDAPDATTYEYTIRTDAVFSDGAKVTPEDVAYSLGLQLDPNVGSLEAALFASVDKISVDGDKVVVKLKHADSLWKFMPAGIGGFVWEKKSVEANLKTYGTPQTLPIGSGPYMVSEFVANSHITLVRNPHYWGTKPQWDKITMKIIPDDQTRLLALRQGDVQGTFAVPNTGIAQWKQAASVTAFSSAIWRGLTLDMEQAPFSDIHVRKALYYATDRNALAQGLLGGLAAVSSTPNDPSMFAGAMSDADIKAGYAKIESFDFDLNKAKQELAQSTVPGGFSTTLNVPEDSATAVQLAQALKEDWSKIGVQLKLNMMPGGPRFQVILAHAPNLGVQIIGNAPDGPDPVELAYQYFSSAQAAKNGNNSSNFKDPQVDSLLDKASQSTDPKQAAQLIMQAQQLASAQVPVIPLVWQQALVAVKQGWTIQPGFSPFYTTSMWINQIHPNS
jgi:peptide/nickel transport system substrate-binding protein